MLNKINHKAYLLERLLSGERLTASQVTQISNSNQYFVELEEEGLITSEWGMLGTSKVKWRFILSEQKDKASKVMQKLKG